MLSIKLPCTKAGVEQVHVQMLKIRDVLRKTKPNNYSYYHAAADLIHLWAHTKVLFTVNEFHRVNSQPFTMEDLGYSHLPKKMAAPKSYGTYYLWAQCCYWFKQTLEKPDTTLASTRRGCITLPFPDCCFGKSFRQTIVRPYDRKNRGKLLKCLEESEWSAWPCHWHWNFKNHPGGNHKTYGSPCLDKYMIDNYNTKYALIIDELKEWNPFGNDDTALLCKKRRAFYLPLFCWSNIFFFNISFLSLCRCCVFFQMGRILYLIHGTIVSIYLIVTQIEMASFLF
ncbi:hypothetical protein RFI_28940 [Reticulomyxa filosa]|uniref:ATXR3 C-terminal domain-containing protein n=1 Tax=Reticulomyxa filosa TaxID=46433 RepID=X6M3A4_RETFI|nr:hypothetical protein RFI_28940 [Reticulomyxa filosa]|eukprot:ETO08448.1 hypothetical protein RFI_28940 [Reticulomyxa filosa]